MSKRVTANRAGMIYGTQYAKDIFEQKEADKVKQVIAITKILRSRNIPFVKATKIAKRAYRMGVRING